MNVEIWISASQYDFRTGEPRRLTGPEVLDRARERLPGWLAWELGGPEDEDRTAAIASALEEDAELGASLTPRALDPARVGIVLTDQLRERVRTAAAA